MTKNSDDGIQIVEQILPFFQPEYTVTINEDYRLSTIDTQSENEWFEDRATGVIGDAVLDFTESNPFGDPTESM